MNYELPLFTIGDSGILLLFLFDDAFNIILNNVWWFSAKFVLVARKSWPQILIAGNGVLFCNYSIHAFVIFDTLSMAKFTLYGFDGLPPVHYLSNFDFLFSSVVTVYGLWRGSTNWNFFERLQVLGLLMLVSGLCSWIKSVFINTRIDAVSLHGMLL